MKYLCIELGVRSAGRSDVRVVRESNGSPEDMLGASVGNSMKC